MLSASDTDILGPILVMDLEWVGNMKEPHTTHVYDMACHNIASGALFCVRIAAAASTACVPAHAAAMDPRQAYTEWLAWLSQQQSYPDETVNLVAHNGMRYDAPVLRCNMLRYGVAIPDFILMRDSLHHLRYHLRHVGARAFDIDALASFCGIGVSADSRHTAQYDAMMLHSILEWVRITYGAPYISGVSHQLNTISTMIIHGVGPTVYCALPTTCLQTMCSDIIREHGDLLPSSCMTYLESCKLKEKVPLCNVAVISEHVSIAAKRHLQYLD